ncbi:MAG TPA: hypothetical protein VND21_06380, partial [Planctomycetota bacterium]|nr:hypothetical protein [Planctomycetota bacterium]
MDEADAPDDDLRALTATGSELDARFGAVFERHRPRLERAIALRIDPARAARGRSAARWRASACR